MSPSRRKIYPAIKANKVAREAADETYKIFLPNLANKNEAEIAAANRKTAAMQEAQNGSKGVLVI